MPDDYECVQNARCLILYGYTGVGPKRNHENPMTLRFGSALD